MEHVYALKCHQAVHDETIVNQVVAVANAAVTGVATEVAIGVVIAGVIAVVIAVVQSAVDVIVTGMFNFVSVERHLSRDLFQFR